MLSFLKLKKDRINKKPKKSAFVMLIITIFFSWSLLNPKPAQAQILWSIPQVISDALVYLWDIVGTALQKAGSIAFQRTLASALNKIAYDAANYVGSGGAGQKPQFVTMNIGEYLSQAADEAAGQFIESFVNNLNTPEATPCQVKLDACYKSCEADRTAFDGYNAEANNYVLSCYEDCSKATTDCASKNANSGDGGNTTPSINVCSPSSLEAKLKIGLGLVQQNRPKGPNCTASEMIKTWKTDINKKIADLRDPHYLDNMASIFDPYSNDVGISYSAKVQMDGTAQLNKESKNSEVVAGGGWLDVRDIAGKIQGVPGEARKEADQATKARQEALGKTTGDIFVDAANLFLNQLAVSSFNNLMQNLTKKAGNSGGHGAPPPPEGSPQGGETELKGATGKILQTNFGIKADYSVISDLAICPDPKNPGPDNCVIDDAFAQAISEKKTVAEAIKEGSLHGDWQITSSKLGDSYHGSYSERNISILVKYRILPVGWQEAARLINIAAVGKKASLNDLIACFDPNDSYTTFSDGFSLGDRGWCVGLVDPNWVLKAPLSYCKKEGFSPNLVFKTVQSNSAMPPAPANVLMINRADGYCGDMETCIKESSNGRCEKYGYCNEEKRNWNFSTDSCEPIDNTCQYFTNKSNNKSTAYLENTLDHSNCDSSKAGCRQYSWYSSAYSTSTDKVTWNRSYSWYLNRSLDICSRSDDGCTELMRVKPTWGSNLIMDSDFRRENVGDTSVSGKLNGWQVLNGIGTSTVVDANTVGIGEGKILKIEGYVNGGVCASDGFSLLPDNFQMIPGQSYRLSADVYLETATKVQIYFTEPLTTGASTTVTGSWQHLSTVQQAVNGFNQPKFNILNYGGVFYLKNLKFEVNSGESGYSPYGSFKVYEKLLPPYLEPSCYVNSSAALKDYNLKPGAPAICSNYARKCNKEEVGCEAFSSVDGKFSVPAQVADSDYCPKECLGYDSYMSRPNYFSSANLENLIPSSATACDANNVACSEFTNLDKLGQGGEQREYYTEFKQCRKPDNNCANFYSWEGQGSGYQLQVYSLKKNGNDEPAVVGASTATCDVDVYNKPVNDPGYNPDCRQFTSVNGVVSYKLMTKTITCSDNCHAYRMSEKNVDKSITQANCDWSSNHSLFWEGGVDGKCYSCLNGGIWDKTQAACVYQAIPGEGKVCDASYSGCREYSGNSGGNVNIAASYDFEVDTNGWSGGGVAQSPVSNNKNGHSLYFPSYVTASHAFPLAQTGASYVAKFMARSDVDLDLQVFFVNGINKDNFSIVKIKGGNEWHLYQASLSSLINNVGPNTKLSVQTIQTIAQITAFYLDNFVLSEVTDRYYLIKNSSQVPDICSYDIFDNYQGPEYNLGCSQYKDRSNLQHNLARFNKLCANSAVGCEQMIDTKNSLDFWSTYWLGGQLQTSACASSDPNCLKVDGDAAIYAVFDQSKQCTAAKKGCSRLGQGQGGAHVVSWLDVFGQNNPDNYSKTLCSQNNVGCEEWSNGDGVNSFFKDPGTESCEYRASQNPLVGGKAWYKIKAKRCDRDYSGKIDNTTEVGSAICVNDLDCPILDSGQTKCIADDNDYYCPVSYLKTIGLGGARNQTPVPDKDTSYNYAGICNSASAGCREYIDPLSKFSNNLVANPTFTGDAYGNHMGWGKNYTKMKWNGSFIDNDQQFVRLEPNKLYSFNLNINPTGLNYWTQLSFINPVRQLMSDNSFGENTNDFRIEIGDVNKPIIFNSFNNSYVFVSHGDVKKNIEIRELVIGYQLSKNIDLKTCNGKVDFSNGCVLFNERYSIGTPMKFDAYNTLDVANSPPLACIGTSTNSYCQTNQLIKVQPDRSCAKWLDCVTYTKNTTTKEKFCSSFGQCDRLDELGECINFVADISSSAVFNAQNDKNASGYSLASNYNFSLMHEVGAVIREFTPTDFENGMPQIGNDANCTKTLDFLSDGACPAPGKIQIIDDPSLSPVDYPAHGRSFLKVPANLQFKLQTLKDIKSVGEYFYLNYLVNTREANRLKSKVILTDDTGKILSDDISEAKLVFIDDASSGWQRVVHRFYLKQGAAQDVDIYLTSNTTNPKDNDFIYYDDFNMEPVLDMGGGKYSARDCRLYPSADSLTCTALGNSLVKYGLEGYCLKYDPANPTACLLWYPMDKIGSTIGKDTKSGYQGRFPLAYCSAANGDYDLVEKREVYTLHAYSSDGHCGNLSNANNGSRSNTGTCGPYFINFYFEFDCRNGNDCCHFEWCIPKNKGTFTASARHLSTSASISLTYTANTSPAANQFTIPPDSEKLLNVNTNYDPLSQQPSCCTTPEYAALSITYNGSGTNIDGWFLPNVSQRDLDKVKVLDSGTLYSLPVLASTSADKYQVNCKTLAEVVDNTGNNMAWAGRVEPSAALIAAPDFFFYNFNNWTGGVVNSTSPTKLNFLQPLTKNLPFGSASLPIGVSLNGYSKQIPLRFDNPKASDILAGYPYGCEGKNCRNIGYCKIGIDTNIGSYCLLTQPYIPVPTNLTTSLIPGYSDSNAIYGVRANKLLDASPNDCNSLLARRGDQSPTTTVCLPLTQFPYSNTSTYTDIICKTTGTAPCYSGISPHFCEGPNCGSVGYCGNASSSEYNGLSSNAGTANATTFPIYCWINPVDNVPAQIDSDLANKSCPSGITCEPLWHSSWISQNNRDTANRFLANIFLKSQNTYNFNTSSFRYVSDALMNYDFQKPNVILECEDGKRADPNKFCIIYPTLSNVNLFFGDESLQIDYSNLDQTFNISRPGIYRIEFNSEVDFQQKPLKQIKIDWGDSNADTIITDQDERPVDPPHTIYHYYADPGKMRINVRVTDNWDAYKEFPESP